MDPERPGPRPGALSDLEAKLLAARVGGRLFQRPAEPVQLGRYRLLGRLGQGGMSVVFRAHDPQLRREVAVKLLHAPRGQPDPEQLARLRREAQALGRLSHPNVVQVFEIGEAEGQSFVVMELVRGTTLREWLAERPRTPAETVAMVSQAGRGLAAAHAAGIIHRDFKPENVLVGADGRARVVDFGLARANPGAPADTATGSLDAPLTKSGTVLGTPAFMAPEQLRDPGRADARADQFSFCVMAWEALHGERPFEDLAAVAAGRMRPPPPGTPVPAALREALARGLRTDPAERWPTMDALLAALAAADGRRAAGGRRRWLLAAGALALVTGALLGGRAWSAHREARAAEELAAALEQRLAGLLAAGQVERAGHVLAEASEAQAARAWASWARLIEQTPGQPAREAWAHAYVFARADAQARETALLGLARATLARREDGRRRAPGQAAALLALIGAEAPGLLATPELAPLHAAARTAGEASPRLDLAQRLAEAEAPPEVVALARAGLLDLAAATLLTLADRAEAPTRARWRLAAATLLAAAHDSPRALALALAAAEEPTIRDAALAELVALHARDGHLEAAAEALATRLRESSAAGPEAQALRERLATTLAARARLSLRFGEADAWTVVDPAAVRGDPIDRALLVTADAGVLAAWPLELRGDRLLVEVTLSPSSLVAGAAFTLAVTQGDATAQVGLRVEHELTLTCAGPAPGAAAVTPLGSVHADQTFPGLGLQLDLDITGGTATCRGLDPARTIVARDIVALRGTWSPGPAALELRGADTPLAPRMRLRITAIDLLGATLGASPAASPWLRAAASLVDGDAHAASEQLAQIPEPRARLWQAIAAIRLGRAQAVAASLERALVEAPDLELELQRWLRDDPDGLAPGLRHALGEARYLQLFARAWSHELGAPILEPALVRRILAELGGLDGRCSGAAACAELHRAHGRALAQIGEPARARRAFEAALAVAPADAPGRALASQLVLDLALVNAP
ncbi:serine/threonine-protein kinase [Nannocystis bainbridge]|uniref:Serine/threonine-protein kinase n=1 Tax=Nannocystis bainbridge TaxID=2995303 RepID=A0ABT5DSB8_9BACT|nr:serine/threonine-protein kinase [Nannocystis bainbridge]MDC0716542.1 serine/threonine-protein kinase [Nannocystis bainbridge]